MSLTGVAVQDALAATLVNDGLAALDGADAAVPLPVDMWLDGPSGASFAGARVAGASAAAGVAANAADEAFDCGEPLA